jgi:hypothetical protein
VRCDLHTTVPTSYYLLGLCEVGAYQLVTSGSPGITEDQTPHWGVPHRLTTQLFRQRRQPSRAHPISVIEGIDITHLRYRVRFPDGATAARTMRVGQASPCIPGYTVVARSPEPLICADRLCGHVNTTGDRCALPAGARFSAATRVGRAVIDLDPLWRLVIVLAAAGVIPLLLALDWVTRRIRDSCTAVLLRSWWRGHCRRRPHRRRPHRRHASAPAGPERARRALGPAGRHARRAP